MISPPQRSPDDADRAVECRRAVDLPLQQLIADATAVGWSTREVLDAIAAELKELEAALSEDPDPAEDPVRTLGTYWEPPAPLRRSR